MGRLSHLVTLTVPPERAKRKQIFKDPDKRRWQLHRINAKQRGVEFKLSFEEWMAWWKATGHYHERGNKRGQYVMARKGDQGAYEIGNIFCEQAQINSTAAHLGKKRSAQVRANMSKALKAAHARRKANAQ